MNFWRRALARSEVTVRPTTGDFPHARRRGVKLACCTCTCCCFTLLLGGICGLTGLVIGLVKAVRTPLDVENAAAAFALGALRLVVFMVAYGIAGILIGAAVGFGIDMILGIW